MNESSLKEKAAKGLLWGGTGTCIRQGINFLMGLILMRNLTPYDYGVVGLLMIFEDLVYIVQNSGFSAALINRSGIVHDDFNAVFWFNVFAGIAIYILLALSSPLLASFFSEPVLTYLAPFVFLHVLITCTSYAPRTMLIKKLMIREIAKADIISLFLSGIVTVIMACSGFGYWSLAVNQVLCSFIAVLLYWKYCSWRPSLFFNFKPIKEMFSFSFSLVLSGVISVIYVNIFSVLLGRYRTRVEVGYFSQGKKWSNLGGELVNSVMNSLVQPVLAGAGTDPERLAEIFRKFIGMVSFLSIPLMLGLAFIGREFITVINPEFLPCVPVLQILCVFAVLSSLLNIYNKMAVTLGRAGFLFWSNLIHAAVQIGMAFYVLRFGIVWLAAINTAVFFIYLLVWHFYINSLVPAGHLKVLRCIFPYAMIMTGVIGTVYFVTAPLENVYMRMGIKICLSAVLYVLVLRIIRDPVFTEALSYLKTKIRKG